jgi:hypothetical protein
MSQLGSLSAILAYPNLLQVLGSRLKAEYVAATRAKAGPSPAGARPPRMADDDCNDCNRRRNKRHKSAVRGDIVYAELFWGRRR